MSLFTTPRRFRASLTAHRPLSERPRIAQEIIAARLALGLRQKDLAARAGIRKATLADLETGRSRPKSTTLERLDCALRELRAELPEARQ
jgi:transcriptional regulator with XRE-family HTH domain